MESESCDVKNTLVAFIVLSHMGKHTINDVLFYAIKIKQKTKHISIIEFCSQNYPTIKVSTMFVDQKACREVKSILYVQNHKH